MVVSVHCRQTVVPMAFLVKGLLSWDVKICFDNPGLLVVQMVYTCSFNADSHIGGYQ